MLELERTLEIVALLLYILENKVKESKWLAQLIIAINLFILIPQIKTFCGLSFLIKLIALV